MPQENYLLRSYSPGEYADKEFKGRIKKSNTMTLSSISLDWDRSLIKSSLSHGTTETNRDSDTMYNRTVSTDFYDSLYAKTQDITRINSDYVCFFDRDYPLRRQYLRDFAQNGEINFILETIADDAVVYDQNNFFAYLDTDGLKRRLKKTEESEKILKLLDESYKRVYDMFGWGNSNDAWEYMKKFLCDGFLAFEILFEYDDNSYEAKDIIGFKELDPTTLEPDIVKDETTGQDIKIWYQYRDDAEKQRIIPDSHVIYISWAKGNFTSRISYLESLTRTFNMLRQLENSRIIWNIQNAQKRIKIVVPVGDQTPDRQRQRLNELKAYYNEDTQINDIDGTMTVNGQPKFSFNKTYIFPSMAGIQTEIEEIGVEGYNLNSTDELKYWWRRFILESKIPANRFLLDPQAAPNNPANGDAMITREEAAFARFVKRIQSVFKEILLKATWIQFCLKQPLFALNSVIPNSIGLKYNNDNQFELAKERATAQQGATAVSSLMGLKKADGTPAFSVKFLIEKYMGLTKEDLKTNENYLLQEKKEAIDIQILAAQQVAGQGGAPGGGMDPGMGGGMDPMMGGDPMAGGMDPMMGGDPMAGGMDPMSGMDPMAGAAPMPDPMAGAAPAPAAPM